MNPAPKVSVIVPVYKAEKYLHRCVDSILAQTFTDFELLLVDDGSPDRSGDICDQYAAADPRVRVFHKPNGGVSSARNLGIEKANGEWLMFVDADDTISKDLFIKSSTHFSDSQIIKFGFNCCSQKTGEVLASRLEKQLNSIKDYRYLILSRDLIVASWSAIFKKELLCKNHILFDKSIKNGEDWLFQVQAIFHAERVITIDYIGYNYYVGGAEACSTQLNAEKIIDSFEAFNKALKCIEGKMEYIGCAKKGFIRLLNYSISNYGYTECTYSHFRHERRKIIQKMPFEIGKFRISNYFESVFPKILMFKSTVLSPILYFIYKIYHLYKNNK